VREPLDSTKDGGREFVAARAEGSSKLGNVRGSCISGLLWCKAGACNIVIRFP
jgi:hypothetical protein